jgi:GYF domain 2
MQIYLAKPGGNRVGPFTLDQIKQDLAARKYRDTDFWAWHEGMTEWMPLYALPEMSKTPAPATPSAPVTPAAPVKPAVTEAPAARTVDAGPTPQAKAAEPAAPSKPSAPAEQSERPEPTGPVEPATAAAGKAPAGGARPAVKIAPARPSPLAAPAQQKVAPAAEGGPAAPAKPASTAAPSPGTPASAPPPVTAQPAAEAKPVAPAEAVRQTAEEVEPGAAQPPGEPRVSSGLPFSALEQIFIFTTGEGRLVFESKATVETLQDTINETLGTIRERISVDVIGRADFGGQVIREEAIPDKAWRAMFTIKPELTQQARDGSYQICVRSFSADNKDTITLVLLYDKSKL